MGYPDGLAERHPLSLSPPSSVHGPYHGIRLGMWRQKRGKASEDAWHRCHLDVAVPEHCVNGVLCRDWVLMGLAAGVKRRSNYANVTIKWSHTYSRCQLLETLVKITSKEDFPFI